MLKTIDFIGGFELHGSKKRFISSHSTKKRQKRPIPEVFCEIPVGSCGMTVKIIFGGRRAENPCW
jgi:hypothetical protein